MMAVLSRVPHCRPQLLPVELGTDMQHDQSMSAPPAEYHGGASSTLHCQDSAALGRHGHILSRTQRSEVPYSEMVDGYVTRLVADNSS